MVYPRFQYNLFWEKRTKVYESVTSLFITDYGQYGQHATDYYIDHEIWYLVVDKLVDETQVDYRWH